MEFRSFLEVVRILNLHLLRNICEPTEHARTCGSAEWTRDDTWPLPIGGSVVKWPGGGQCPPPYSSPPRLLASSLRLISCSSYPLRARPIVWFFIRCVYIYRVGCPVLLSQPLSNQRLRFVLQMV